MKLKCQSTLSATLAGLAGLLLCTLTGPAWGQGQLVLSNKWSVDATSRTYLGTNSNYPRSALINRVTGHVLVPNTTPSNQVAILSGVDGADLGSLNVDGLTGGHSASFNILMGGVANDGVIYMGNLQVNPGVFRIWRWSSEAPDEKPVCVFGPADPGPTATRIGDALAVRGAGTNTQIIAAGTGSGYFTVFTTADGTNFTAHQFALPDGVAAGQASRGVPFDGTNNAFYAIKDFSSTVHHIGFDLQAGTSWLIEDLTLSVPGSCISVANLEGFKIMAGVNDDGGDSSAHRLMVYDISNPAAPFLAEGGLQRFPGERVKDGNGTGSTEIGAGMIVGFNTHNGLIALSVAVVTNPPSILVQPQDLGAFAGSTATFYVGMAGTPPLHYQWAFNGNPIADATTSSLRVANVQSAQAGNYTVTITNIVGKVTSAAARLTIATPGRYSAAVLADHPVAYWRLGELGGTIAHDAWAGHDGVYSNPTLGQPGYSLVDTDKAVGNSRAKLSGVTVADNTAFNFSGLTPAFTLEGWVNLHDFDAIQRLFSDVDYSVPGTSSGIGFGVVDANKLRFTTYGVQDFDLELTGYGPLVPGRWYHLAGVADGAGSFNFYLDGQLVGSIAFANPAVASTQPFVIGGTPSNNETLNGLMDEMAVYATALTPDQILAHYNARYGTATAPLIRTQPVPVTNYLGLAASFAVQAEGSGWLSYQWQKDGVDVPGAVYETLTVSPLEAASAGLYTVKVSGVGTTTSAPARLTVLSAPTGLDLSAGLVLHLKFDGDYVDYSGRGNHGTNMGATTFASDGKVGKAVQISTDSGSSAFNYVALGLRPDLQFGASVNFSVAYWVRLPAWATPGDLPFLCNAAGSGNSFGYTFCPGYTTGGWRWTLNDNTHNINDVGPGSTINDGNWHHLVHTFDRAGLAVTYLDGVPVESRSITVMGNLDTGLPTNVGQDPTGTYGEDGSYDLDDLGVWRRVLSPMEAAGIYSAGASNGVSFVSLPVRLQAQRVAGQVQLTWAGGLLQAADEVNGTYTDVAEAASPYTVPAAAARKFYRVRQ